MGLDSYIIPITPNGTDIFLILRPLGLSHSEITFPTGSSNSMISSILLVIESILSLFNVKRSIIAEESNFLLAFSISFLFTFNISSENLIIFFFNSRRASFFILVEILDNNSEAFFALVPNSKM